MAVLGLAVVEVAAADDETAFAVQELLAARCAIAPAARTRRRSGEKGDLQKEPPVGIFVEPADHGLGRSRGGLTSKIHLAVEQGQKPLSVVNTAGRRGDSPQFEPVLEAIRVPRAGRGPTRRTIPAATAPTCVDAESRRGSAVPADRVRNRLGRARAAAVRRSSTRTTTSSGTRSSARSIASTSSS
ncbi:DUF6207 family protein [Streptomyces eurythermus]|uniref:DUF6207 family protein n=1 Tax=Streptomyces eurythermus TaxID=42237 RepID=A0ABW6YTJ2_9ACTN